MYNHYSLPSKSKHKILSIQQIKIFYNKWEAWLMEKQWSIKTKIMRTPPISYNRTFYLISRSSGDVLKTDNWTVIEEYILFEAQNILGNKWTSIMILIPQKSANDLKNHFYSTLRKTIRRFIKGKFNYSIFIYLNIVNPKQKIRAYYMLIFIRSHMIKLNSTNTNGQKR